MDQNALVPICKLKTAGANTQDIYCRVTSRLWKAWIVLVADWGSPGASAVLKRAEV